jgi:hypothetical protein
MDFADAVKGKTVAIVGPAPAVTDQSAEVESHDLVYWVSYRNNLQPHPTGYGQRVDAVMYNAGHSRECELGKYDSFIKEIPYVFMKQHKRAGPNNNYPMVPRPFGKANQIQMVLFQLLALKPKEIRVYGADLYFSGPGKAYDFGYDRRTPEAQFWGVSLHEPKLQHSWTRQAWLDNQNVILGDERFLTPLRLSTKQYLETLHKVWSNE